MGRGSLPDLPRPAPSPARRLRLAQAAALAAGTSAAGVPRDALRPPRAEGVARRALRASPPARRRRSRGSRSSSAASRPTACGACRNTAAFSPTSSSAPRPARPPRGAAAASSSRRSSRGPTRSRPRSSRAARSAPPRRSARDRARGPPRARGGAAPSGAPRRPRGGSPRSTSSRAPGSPPPREVERLHEALCFLRAYPDDAAVLARTEALLARFARRPDLKRHRAALDDSGIAGTKTRFPFFAGTARWLAARWGKHLRVDWRRFEKGAALERLLPLVSLWAETPALDELDLGTRGWVKRLKGPAETDAAFLVRRARDARPGDVREGVRPGRASSCRSSSTPAPARPPGRTPAFGRRPSSSRRGPSTAGGPTSGASSRGRRSRSRPSLAGTRSALSTSRRKPMVARARDLDAFQWGDPEDVRLVTYPDGLSFAAIGVVPERRLLLESRLRVPDAQERRPDRLRPHERPLRLLRDRLQRLRVVPRRRVGPRLRQGPLDDARPLRLGRLHDLPVPARRLRQPRGARVRRVVVLPEARLFAPRPARRAL